MSVTIQITEDEIKALILSQIETQQGVQIIITFGIVVACVVPIIVLLWYFLHPKSPYVRKRADKEHKIEREETEAKRKEEQREVSFKQKLQELNYTCKQCKAPGLKGPKCEYCGHINFSID